MQSEPIDFTNAKTLIKKKDNKMTKFELAANVNG